MSKRVPILCFAALMAAAPLATAEAQSRRPSPLIGQLRQEQAREESREGRRVDMSDVVRRVAAGRPGRMLGVSERGGGASLTYVVRWEYPGGRIADISVDGRTGRVLGER